MPQRSWTSRLATVRRSAQRRTSNLYDTYFTRRISGWITAALAPAGISPNGVTLTNVVVGVSACLAIGLGQRPLSVLVGVAMIHLYAILDSVDGELARLLNRPSLKGVVLEAWSAYVMAAAFPFAIALYLDSRAALVTAVVLAVLAGNAMPALRRALSEVTLDSTPRASVTSPSPETRAPARLAWIEGTLLHQTNVRVVLSTLVAVDVLVGFRGPLSAVFFAYAAALMARELGILHLIMRGDLIDREADRYRGLHPSVVEYPDDGPPSRP